MRRRSGSALWCLALLASTVTGVRAQTVTYTGAASYSGGSYIFDRRSDSYALSTGLRVASGSVSFGISVPVLVYNGGLITSVASGVPLPTGGTQSGAIGSRGPGETVGTRGTGKGPGGGQGVPPPAGTPSDTTVEFVEDFSVALADPVLALEAEIYSGFGVVRSIGLASRAKVPLADVSTGVTSGRWDFGVGASAVLGIGEALLLADLGYWWLGDMAELPLADGVSYALGVSTPVGSKGWSVMGLLTGLSQTINDMDPPITVTGSLSRPVGQRAFGSIGAGFGLTESAPDLYLSMGWSVRLGAGGG